MDAVYGRTASRIAEPTGDIASRSAGETRSPSAKLARPSHLNNTIGMHGR
jgi:hypothetical protein